MRYVWLVLLLLSGCAPSSDTVGTSQATLGEPLDGFPSWQERVIWVWANRSRADPAADLADCRDCAESACYEPRPPLGWGHQLSRAARFHATTLRRSGAGLGIMHDSPCELPADISDRYVPGPCEGEASCACEGGAFTGSGPRFQTRVGRFGTSASYENIAFGLQDPVRMFYLWLHEPFDATSCGYGYDSRSRPNGHRYAILNAGGSVGVGYYERYWVQDFGGGDPAENLVTGVHTPERGEAVEFRANWFAAAAPSRAEVNVDGSCTELMLERGTPVNGTYLGDSTGAGCRHYYFSFTDASGAEYTFPSTGSYGIDCAGDWSAERPPACGCTPMCRGRVCGGDGCGGTCGACEESESCVEGACACVGADCPGGDAGLPPSADAGAAMPADAGPEPSEDGGSGGVERDAGVASDTLRGGCRVALDGPRTGGLAPLFVALIGLGWRLRARARR